MLRAREYARAASSKYQDELDGLLALDRLATAEHPSLSMSERLRVRELQALIEQEQGELLLVEKARDLGLNTSGDLRHIKAELARKQTGDRRKVVLELVQANHISTIKRVQELLAERGYVAESATISSDLKELNIIRYRPAPGEPVRLVPLTRNKEDDIDEDKLIEFALANATTFSLQELRRKGDTLFLACTHRTAGHLHDVLLERRIPDVVSILSDSHSTIWVECEDEKAARGIETLLRRYLVWGS